MRAFHIAPIAVAVSLTVSAAHTNAAAQLPQQRPLSPTQELFVFAGREHHGSMSSFSTSTCLGSGCGGSEALQCGTGSTALYWLINAVSPTALRYTTWFERACIGHDMCYRHGYVTYGRSRTYCDDQFYERMKAICEDPKILIVLTGGLSLADCLVGAFNFYRTVQNLGEGPYKREDSTCCEYEVRLKAARGLQFQWERVPATTTACRRFDPSPAALIFISL